MSSASQFWTRNYQDAMVWAKFRRNVLLAAVGTFVGYSLGTAHFLSKRFDREFTTEDFQKRVLKYGVEKKPPPGVYKELTEEEKEKQKILSERDRHTSRTYKGSNSFDALRARAYKPDKLDLSLLDGFQRPVISVNTALYLESSRSPLCVWDEAAATLSPGDLILTKGTGSMSWKITNLTYPWTNFDPWSLKYSHVSVVVDVDRSKDPPDVWVLEAADNRDGNLPSRDGKVRHAQVQVVNAADRLFSVHPDEKVNWFQDSLLGKVYYTFFAEPPSEEKRYWNRRCFSRAAVRRLEGFEWTAESKKKLEEFLQKNVGRPMDKSPLLSLAQLKPSLYNRKNPEEISCTELILDMYKYVGAVVGDDIDLRDNSMDHLIKKSLTYIPYHFTPKGERMYPIIWKQRKTHLGPEEKVLMNW
jgi:hypothetical protein